MEKLWEGRFSEQSSKLLEDFNASIMFDKLLYAQDIRGSIAHASMLKKCKILQENEADEIIRGLNLIKDEIESAKFEFKISDEDIHMAVEKRLGELIGKELSGKLHTARSRNDQVALDFRLYVQENSKEIANLMKNLISTLNEIAKSHKDHIMPGFTHLQHAQPISLAYHLLAYAFMFKRDYERLMDSHKRNNYSPLGCAALAGTPHPIDRFEVARILGFEGVTPNCLDTVSDRDFAIEILFNISLIFMHTSRLCEELILWSCSEFNFIEISDKFSTGSSIMPQKKNPDVAELIRGKTGRVYGNLVSLLTTMKALPLAYNKDTQEDKERVFDSIKTAKDSIIILTQMLKEIKFNKENMLKACKCGHLTATDLADFLAKNGVPFRKAHFIVGKIVAFCEKKGIDISEISAKDLENASKEMDYEIDLKALEVLKLANSKEARVSFGGTANKALEAQFKILDEFLK